MSTKRRYDTVYCSTDLMIEALAMFPYSNKAKLAAEGLRLLIERERERRAHTNDDTPVEPTAA